MLVVIKYINDTEIYRTRAVDIAAAACFVEGQVETYDLVLEGNTYWTPDGDTVRFAFDRDSGTAILLDALSKEVNKDG